MTGTINIEELRKIAYKKWYQFGWRSPVVLYKRVRSAHPWNFRLRMAWQRAVRGHSDEQLWGLNHSLAKLTVAGVQAMRKWQHGYPSEFAEPEHGGNGGGWEEWDNILRRIEEGFQAYLDEDGWFHEKPEQEAKFKDALELQAHWFSALWD